MLQDEFTRLTKSVGNVSSEQAKRIIGTVLDRIKVDANALIVDVWTLVFGYNNDVLQPYLRRNAPNVPSPHVVTLGNNSTGLLVWVAENKRPIWLDDVAPKATSATNRLTDQIIEGRYYNLYDRTRAFAAVPITYKGRFLAILTLEVAVASSLKSFHIDIMQALADPIGVLLLNQASLRIAWHKRMTQLMIFRILRRDLASH